MKILTRSSDEDQSRPSRTRQVSSGIFRYHRLVSITHMSAHSLLLPPLRAVADTTAPVIRANIRPDAAC